MRRITRISFQKSVKREHPGAPQKQEALTPFEQKLVQLSKEGKVILAKRRKSIAKLPKITEAEKSIDIAAILDEVRADRFP